MRTSDACWAMRASLAAVPWALLALSNRTIAGMPSAM